MTDKPVRHGYPFYIQGGGGLVGYTLYADGLKVATYPNRDEAWSAMDVLIQAHNGDVAREREACALIADTTVQLEGWNNVADAIRARGQEMNHDAR